MATKKELTADIEENVQPEEPQGERTVRIMLPYDENAGDEVVWLNARQFIIQRGVEVDVPEGVAEILQNRDREIRIMREKAAKAAEEAKARAQSYLG